MKNLVIWELNPALLYGLAFLFGWLTALASPLASLPFCVLLFTAFKKTPYLVAVFLLPLPILHHMPQKDEGRFHIERLDKQFGWVYRGVFNHRPIIIRSKEYHKPTHDYYLEGSWNQKGQFEPHSWTKLKRYSLAYQRQRLHQQTKALIKRHFKYEDAAVLISGMLTGKLDDLELKKRCQTLGLSHLLAVSGFHFAILYFALHAVVSRILPRTPSLITLGILMSLYGLFVGSSPSTLRAWLFMMFYLIGQLTNRQSSALNTLGSALLVSLMINPFSCLTLSFQLSFLATGGIFLYYHPIRNYLLRFVPKHTVHHVVNYRSKRWGVCYMLSSLSRDLFALTLAVHPITFPLLLYHFNLLWIHSLFYNLFYPFLFSIALLLLPLFPVCDLYTHLLLKGIYHPIIIMAPITWNLGIKTMIVLLLSIVGFGLIRLERKTKQQLFSYQ